jgi:S-adenosyl methyltransferase
VAGAADAPGGDISDLDTGVAHPARVYDYWLGGTDNFPADREAAERVLAATQTLRTREQVGRFLAGLDLVDPGLVQVHQWRPDPDDPAPADAVSAHGGVGRKLCDPAPGTGESGGYYLRRQLRPVE